MKFVPSIDNRPSAGSSAAQQRRSLVPFTCPPSPITQCKVFPLPRCYKWAQLKTLDSSKDELAIILHSRQHTIRFPLLNHCWKFSQAHATCLSHPPSRSPRSADPATSDRAKRALRLKHHSVSRLKLYRSVSRSSRISHHYNLLLHSSTTAGPSSAAELHHPTPKNTKQDTGRRRPVSRSPTMSQQALFADTIIAMKKAMKRRAYGTLL